MRPAAAPEGPARHPLPQSTLHVPLFVGVEAPILGFEVVAVAVLVHLVGLRWVPLAMFGAGVAAAHIGLARATAKDRRLAMVFARSVRYPAYARPWAVLESTAGVAGPGSPHGTHPAGRGTRPGSVSRCGAHACAGLRSSREPSDPATHDPLPPPVPERRGEARSVDGRRGGPPAVESSRRWETAPQPGSMRRAEVGSSHDPTFPRRLLA